MRNHLSHITVAIFTAALAVACANNGPNNERKVQSGGERGTNDRVTLNGCVTAAPGDSYELRGVSEPAPETQATMPPSDHPPLVERGSWVRLAAGNDELKQYVGKHVTVRGEIRDRGTNTIGTAGQSSPMPRAGEANGQPPLIAVEKVSESAGSCPTESGRR
jgi:hypothetical protein